MENITEEQRRRPWLWVPSLYLCEGIPYVIVMTMALVMYKDMGISNTDTAFYTSWFSLPWVLKPLWSPWVDINRTKRFWILAMQFVISVSLVALAGSLLTSRFFVFSLVLFFAMACCSATHDIAADGFYMLGLTPHEQAWWIGLRNTFYRVAMTSSGWVIVLVGVLESRKESIPTSWSLAIFAATALYFVFCLWHLFILPRPSNDGPVTTGRSPGTEFLGTFGSFCEKPGLGMALAFILLYRLDEAQLLKVTPLFLLDPVAKGGLGLTQTQYGMAYGICGIVALTCGGLAGGFLAARRGLKAMLPIMLGAMYLPKLVFIFLSYAQPTNLDVIGGAIAVEQFGYGFGFTAFMLYLLYFANGPHRTAHYAICTGFMALGIMIPGLWSGWLADLLGYRHFFIWIFWSAVPGLIIALLLKVDPRFGKR